MRMGSMTDVVMAAEARSITAEASALTLSRA
jgi:hypothetical protein